MSKIIFRRDLICHAHVVSLLECGVETDVRNVDVALITKKFIAKESRDVKL